MIAESVINNYKEDGVDNLEISASIETLYKRCSDAAIKVREVADFDNPSLKSIVIERNAGREIVNIIPYNYGMIKKLLSIEFEKYTFLYPYQGICSYEKDIIECIISGRIKYIEDFFALKEGKIEGVEESEDNIEVKKEFILENGKIKIQFREPTEEARILLRDRPLRQVSLIIKGTEAKTYDQVLKTLSKLSGSLFFQFDLSYGIALELQRAHGRHILRGRTKEQVEQADVPTFPKQEFDEAPLALYWYGRNANNMPLLQYLSFFQVIEFYFPIYYKTEIKKRITKVLKDPTFRYDKDTDISRLLGAFKGKSFAYGDERTMLKATINECIDAIEIRSFIESSDKLKEQLSIKIKGVTDVKIPINNPDADLRNEIAERIYDIRCKIVHTKSDGMDNSDIILPFSPEAELMHYDISLIQYISQQVLINSSTALKI